MSDVIFVAVIMLFFVGAVLFLAHTVISMQAEAHGNGLLPVSVSQLAAADNPGGNLEGKELRFGADGSALMTVRTMGNTAGATDSALDSYTPVGGTGAFVAFLLGVIVIVGGLIYLPMLILGPIGERIVG